MKVIFKISLEGHIRPDTDFCFEKDSFEFCFLIDEVSKLATHLLVTIKNVSKEKWPTLEQVPTNLPDGMLQFPFQVQNEALHFSDIEEQIISLESILTVFGLNKLNLESVETIWEQDTEDEVSTGMMTQFRADLIKEEPQVVAMSVDTFARAICSAGNLDLEIFTLSHYRTAIEHIEARRFLDSIRHLYLSIENEFQLPQKKRGAIDKMRNSERLRKYVEEIKSNQSVKLVERFFLKHKINPSDDFCDWFFNYLFELRGKLQHSNKKTMIEWSPSKQSDFEDDAGFLMNLVDGICWDIVQKKLNSVKIDPT